MIKVRKYQPVFSDLNERHVTLNTNLDYRQKLLALIDLLMVDCSTGDYDSRNRAACLSAELIDDLLDIRGM